MTTRRTILKGILGALAAPAAAKAAVKAPPPASAAPAVNVGGLTAVDANLGPHVGGIIRAKDGSFLLDVNRGTLSISSDRRAPGGETQ